MDKQGDVANKLDLPKSSQIHPVFHVSQLKKLVGNVQTSNHLPDALYETKTKEPEYCLDGKMVKRQGRAATMVLVKWKNEAHDEASWEYMFDVQKKFLDFQPCGQGPSGREDLLLE